MVDHAHGIRGPIPETPYIEKGTAGTKSSAASFRPSTQHEAITDRKQAVKKAKVNLPIKLPADGPIARSPTVYRPIAPEIYTQGFHREPTSKSWHDSQRTCHPRFFPFGIAGTDPLLCAEPVRVALECADPSFDAPLAPPSKVSCDSAYMD